MKKFMILIAVVCAMVFFVSCGGSSSEEKNGENNDPTDPSESTDPETTDDETTDSEITDSEVTDEEPAEETPDEPEELAYPEVTPTSNKNGDIAQNITIYDDLDVEHHLAEWYKPNNKDSKLIWLIFTTYDCGPCRILKEDLLEINKAEYRKQGLKIVLVFNGLLSGPQPDLEPAKLADVKDMYLSEYPDTGRFEIYGYLKQEEQKVLRKFFSSPIGGAYPTWAFINADNMEILEYGEGWAEDNIDAIEEEIEYILEEF